MAVESQSGIPCQFTAGDAILFTLSDADHPASLWDMSFVLSRQGAKLAAIAATASGDNYQVSISATVSSLSPGICQYSLVFTEKADATQRETGATGWLTILPNPAVSLTQTDNQAALAACQTAITTLLASPDKSVSFNGQSFTSLDIGELFQARDRLRQLVDNELAELGIGRKGGARLIRFRF